MARTITTRPARAEDEDFRREVYFSTRIAEVAEFGWSDDQQKAFLQMQFSVRQRAYEMQFPKAESSIILVNDAPAGTMIVDRAADHISLTDIAILPEYRHRGIAMHLIGELQKEAK